MFVYDGLGTRFNVDTVHVIIPNKEGYVIIPVSKDETQFVPVKNVRNRWFFAYEREVSDETVNMCTLAASKNAPVYAWHLEIRKSEDGSIEGTDKYVGTEQEAIQDAKHWLKEVLTLNSYKKEILVINTFTNECIYQGTFDLIPDKLEIGNYIAVVLKMETVNEDETTQIEDIVEYGTVIKIDDNIVRIADDLDLTGKPTKDSQLFEFPFSSTHVVLISKE